MKSRVHNPKYLEKYFTQFPNIIDDSELSPFEFRLLIHYYRVGECWEGVRKTAQICKMSTGKVATSRKTLEEKGFIKIEEKGDGIIIFLEDLSRKNLERYSAEGVHHMDSSVHHMNEGCSPHELKKNHSKKNHLRRSSESEDSDVPKTLFPEVVEQESKEKEKNLGRKKKEKVVDECYQDFVKAWTEAYPILGFDAISGTKIKSLIQKTRSHVRGSGREDSREMVLNSFLYVLAYVQRVNHFCHGKPITTWDNQYLSIIMEISNGKSAGQKRQSPSEYINSLKESR